MLKSTNAKYDAPTIWREYLKTLEPGDPLISLPEFTQWKESPPPIACSFRRFESNVTELLKRHKFELYDDASEYVDLYKKEFPPKADRLPPTRCIRAVMCRLAGLKYACIRVRCPRQYPMTPLEEEMWEEADRDPIKYWKLAGNYNRDAPMWVLYFRQKFNRPR